MLSKLYILKFESSIFGILEKSTIRTQPNSGFEIGRRFKILPCKSAGCRGGIRTHINSFRGNTVLETVVLTNWTTRQWDFFVNCFDLSISSQFLNLSTHSIIHKCQNQRWRKNENIFFFDDINHHLDDVNHHPCQHYQNQPF